MCTELDLIYEVAQLFYDPYCSVLRVNVIKMQAHWEWRVRTVAYLPQPRPVRSSMLLKNAAKHPVDYNVSVKTSFTSHPYKLHGSFSAKGKWQWNVTQSLSLGELV